MTWQEILQSDKPFRYQLLNRHQMDCDYYLGNGRLFGPHLWAGNVPEHIQNMKDLYNSFADDEKPEWLTMMQIIEYERLMTQPGVYKIVAIDGKTVHWMRVGEEVPVIHKSIVSVPSLSEAFALRSHFYTEENHCVFVDECLVDDDLIEKWNKLLGKNLQET